MGGTGDRFPRTASVRRGDCQKRRKTPHDREGTISQSDGPHVSDFRSLNISLVTSPKVIPPRHRNPHGTPIHYPASG